VPEGDGVRGSGSGEGRTRILWLIKGLGAGGAERLLLSAAELADRRAFSLQAAYLLPWKDALVGDLERAGVEVRCLGGGREWDLRWALRLRRLLRRERFDVVHVHSPYVAGFARLVVRSLPRDRRPKLMTTEHLPWYGYRRATRWLTRATFALDDLDVAVSEAVAESIPRKLRARVHVNPNGVAVEEIRARAVDREATRASLGAGDGEILIGTIARLDEQKDYAALLAAARSAIDAGAPVRFVAVGIGPLEEVLVERHRILDLGDRFRFLGRVEDPIRILAACDVFVLASRYEGLSVALLEAISVGLPVIATAVPGIVGVVRDGREARLVPPSDPASLSRAIVELAGDADRRVEMGRAACSRAEAFDVGLMVRRTEELYRSIAPGPSRSDVGVGASR
jgi:glycosyltransferase involved in cell wall biosynthesis